MGEDENSGTCPVCAETIEETCETCPHCQADTRGKRVAGQQTEKEPSEEAVNRGQDSEASFDSAGERPSAPSSDSGAPGQEGVEDVSYNPGIGGYAKRGLAGCGVGGGIILIFVLIVSSFGTEVQERGAEAEAERLEKLAHHPSQSNLQKLTDDLSNDEVRRLVADHTTQWEGFFRENLEEIVESVDSPDEFCDRVYAFVSIEAFPETPKSVISACDALSTVQQRLEELKDLEEEVERLRDRREQLRDRLAEERQSYGVCQGVISQQLGDRQYEFRDGTGGPKLLVTTRTEFTSDGRFTLPCQRQGSVEMRLKNGFERSVPKYVEASTFEEDRIATELSDIRSEIEAAKEKVADESDESKAGLESEVEQLGEKVYEAVDYGDLEEPSEVEKSMEKVEEDPAEVEKHVTTPSISSYRALTVAPRRKVKQQLKKLSMAQKEEWQAFFSRRWPELARERKNDEMFCMNTDVFAEMELLPKPMRIFHAACSELVTAPGHKSQIDRIPWSMRSLSSNKLKEVVSTAIEAQKSPRADLEAPDKTRVDALSSPEHSTKILKAKRKNQVPVYESQTKESPRIGTLAMEAGEVLPTDFRDGQFFEIAPPRVVAMRGGVIIDDGAAVAVREGEPVYVQDRLSEGGGYILIFDGDEYTVSARFFDAIGVDRPERPSEWTFAWLYTAESGGGWMKVTSEDFRAERKSTMP